MRAKTKPAAERVGKYMIWPVLALEQLTFLEPEGKVGYRWGRAGAEQETMLFECRSSGLFVVVDRAARPAIQYRQ